MHGPAAGLQLCPEAKGLTAEMWDDVETLTQQERLASISCVAAEHLVAHSLSIVAVHSVSQSIDRQPWAQAEPKCSRRSRFALASCRFHLSLVAHSLSPFPLPVSVPVSLPGVQAPTLSTKLAATSQML